MGVTIGIRREDKNEWERRVPLVPADLAELPGRQVSIYHPAFAHPGLRR